MPASLQDELDGIVRPNANETNAEGRMQSPLLTARKVSTFDEVQLSEPQDDGEVRGRSTTASSHTSERSQSRSSVSGIAPKSVDRASSISNATPLTTATWGAPSVPRLPVSASMSRKISSPFSWLSRKKSAPQGSTSPPQPSFRRPTATSISTTGSNADMILSRLDEERVTDHPSGSKRQARESLRERFKLLRMREEAGINFEDTEQQGSTGTESAADAETPGLGIVSPVNILEGKEDISLDTSVQGLYTENPVNQPVTQQNSTTSNFDPHLAPGTASGISAGPSAMQDPEAPVDWDLWQSVVYEGPAAVAKSSPGELNRAIASGIPSAIRGVVWQVLAQSKNEELEGVYRELVARGTDKEREFESPKISSGPHSANSLTSNGTHKESIASSSSSVRSGTSTPATANEMTSPSSSQETESTNAAKLQAAMNAERQKRAKDDVAALKKLEKTIRKDLGARSNYSKYAAAAGLQEGLFGVCKAYALFDEAVGYAQGMNFIVMPLLFNVRISSASEMLLLIFA